LRSTVASTAYGATAAAANTSPLSPSSKSWKITVGVVVKMAIEKLDMGVDIFMDGVSALLRIK